MYVAIPVRAVRAPSLSGLGRRRRRFVGRGLGYQVGDRLTDAELAQCRYVAEPGWAYFHDNPTSACSVSYKQYSGDHLPFNSLLIEAPRPEETERCMVPIVRCPDGRFYDACRQRSTDNYPCNESLPVATSGSGSSSSNGSQPIQPCRVLPNGMRVCVAPIFRPDGSVYLPPIGGPADENPLLPAIFSGSPSSSAGSSISSAVSEAVSGITTEVTSWWDAARAKVHQVPTWGWIAAGAGVAYLYSRKRRRGF